MMRINVNLLVGVIRVTTPPCLMNSIPGDGVIRAYLVSVLDLRTRVVQERY